jgi:chemotaxis protein methyltransferase CheR
MSLSAPEFQFLRTMVYRDSAIVLGEDHSYLLEARLAAVAQSQGIADVSALARRLQRDNDPTLRRKVVETMTTNETSFFRDLGPFELLRTKVFPDLLQRRASERSLRIWSAASSTGQEACSLGMTLLEHHRSATAGWDLRILGTDLSTTIVEKARSGTYTQPEMNRGLPAPLLMRYFARSGAAWQTLPVLRDMLDFQQMNLAAPWRPLPKFDLIFLRNVLIYFDEETRRAILTRVRSVLRKDGYLFLGGADTIRDPDSGFECVRSGTTHYFQLKA